MIDRPMLPKVAPDLRAAGAVACALWTFAFLYWGLMPSAAENDSLTIGAVLPLTGDAAHWGIPPSSAAQLAVDEINRAGGIRDRKLAFVVEDDRCQPAEGISAFNKIMAAVNPPAILGAVCSGVTLAVAQLAEARKTVLISPASTSPKITDAGDFIFRVIPSGSLRAKVLAEYIFGERALRKLAVLYINNEGGIGASSAFKAQFTQLGGTILLEQTYGQGATDIRAQLTKIRAANPDGVIVGSYPADTVLIIQQAHELALQSPLFFTTESPENPEVLRQAADAANGVSYILAAPAAGEATQRFTRAYEERFKHKPELFAAEGYDIIHLIAAAIAATGPAASGPGIRDFLYQVRNYPGASGTITFDQNGDVIKPYAIKRIENGSPRTIFVK